MYLMNMCSSLEQQLFRVSVCRCNEDRRCLICLGCQYRRYSLGARDGFTKLIFYKRFDRFSLEIRQNALRKQWSTVTSLGERLLGLN